MKPRTLGSLLPLLLLPLAAGPVGLTGCELFGLDDSELEINVPEQVIGPVNVPLDKLPVTVPQGETVTRWVGTTPTPLDLIEAQPELEKYKDTIQRIEIRSITYRIVSNTLDAELPPLEIWFGPEDVSLTLEDPAKDSRLVKYGQTEPIQPGATMAERQPIQPGAGAVDAVAELMSDLSFSTLSGAHFVLQGGDTVPSGEVELELALQLTVFVKPY